MVTERTGQTHSPRWSRKFPQKVDPRPQRRPARISRNSVLRSFDTTTPIAPSDQFFAIPT